MSNEELVARIKVGIDVPENMNQLYLQMKGLIHIFAEKYRDSGLAEDLEQEGYLALYPAVDGYDPEAGCKFSTYAGFYIRQGMQRYLENNGCTIRRSAHLQQRVQQYRCIQNEALTSRGRELTDREAARKMNLSIEQIVRVWESAEHFRMVSMDSPIIGRDGEEDATLGELLPTSEDIEDTVLERIQQEQLKETLWSCVDELPKRYSEVLHQRYQERKPYREIGELQGVSTARIEHIHMDALRELRKSRHKNRLRPYLEESRIYSAALVGNGAKRFSETWTSSTERVALRRLEGQGDRT